MPMGLVGQKVGMTRIFTEDGKSHGVTVVHIDSNKVVQIKKADSEGYDAVQVTLGEKKLSKVNKALKGHYAKAEVAPGLGLWEFTASDAELAELKVGQELSLDLFKEGQMVDVVADSKGRGFAGVIKRHKFKSQRATHGNSLSHNAPGSIGQCQTPGRVFKGKKMAGHMGSCRTTVQSQKIIKIDADKGLIFIAGSVPGAASGFVLIQPAVKAKKAAAA